MPYREIADALGSPINTVKTLIHRARAALARALGGTKGETGGV
jgi:DNA-directed RNA polymerase specialized sigma24 family protein